MDISKINSEIRQIGYNSFGINGTNDEDIKKFAQENSISVEEARNIFKQAEEQAEKNDRLANNQNSMLEELLNSNDEEEIEIVDDIDFDNFLKEKSPEQQMQDIFSQQKFVQQNNSQNQFNTLNIADMNSQNNPFINLKWD